MNLDSLAELFAPPALNPELRVDAKFADPPSFMEQFTPKQWAALERHPEILDALRMAYGFGLERSAGIAPDHYTASTVCDKCGPVSIWEGAPETVQGCPWCGNRIEGLPIPRVTHRPAKEGGGGGPVALPGHAQDLLNSSPSKEIR